MSGHHFVEFLDAFLGWAERHRVGLIRAGAIVGRLIAVPAFLIFLIPHLLVWFAPKLDLSQDLYAVNRPVAFTFLDE